MKHEERLHKFVEAIWTWYARHKRELPWRDMDIADDTGRAYQVLVSEVMLQQTQVSRVKIVFKNFLECFPTIRDLAQASNKDVILAWRGMGYNSRALRLRDAARSVVEEFDGVFPTEMHVLRSIKGLGPYTAAAIRNFAFNLPTPCIDTNIRRILHRTFVGPEHPDGTWQMSDRDLLNVADEVLHVAIGGDRRHRGERGERSDDGITQENSLRSSLPSFPSTASLPSVRRTAADWHAALMDYGSLIQTKSNPKWDLCILTERRLMKTTPASFKKIRHTTYDIPHAKKEPGRFVGSVYIPNRIFRGKIIEVLRDHHEYLTTHDIGIKVCIDWNPKEHLDWMENLIKKLVQEELVEKRQKGYVLAE